MSKVKKFFKKIAPIALPILGNMLLPGIGGVLGGAAGGAMGGGGLKGALFGGAMGGLGSGALGTAAGSTLGGGMQGATMGSGMLGAATRGSGFLSSALRGGANALGNAGGYLPSFGGSSGQQMANGIPVGAATSTSGIPGSAMNTAGMTNITAPSGFGSMAQGATNITAPATFAGGIAPSITMGAGSMIPNNYLDSISPTQSSGWSDTLKGALMPEGGSMPGGGTINALGKVYSGIQGDQAYKDMARAQTSANERALGAVSPYMQTGESANTRLSSLLGLNGENEEDVLEGLRTSPGYQFRQEQGEKSLGRALSAQGGLQSGRAAIESQRMGQGLADQTYNDYVKNLYAQQQQGRGAATGAMPYYATGGDINANAIRSRQEGMDRTLSDLMNPRGY